MIITKQAKINLEDLPNDYSIEVIDFVNKLIQRKPKLRLGKNNINELINHPWFIGFDWDNLLKKKITSPYLIKDIDNYDKKYCLISEKIGEETLNRYKLILKDFLFEENFKNFNMEKIPEELKVIHYTKAENFVSDITPSPLSRNKNSYINYSESKSNSKLMSLQNSIHSSIIDSNKLSNVIINESRNFKQMKKNFSNLNGTFNSIFKKNNNNEKNLFYSRITKSTQRLNKEINNSLNEKLFKKNEKEKSKIKGVNKSYYKSNSVSIINSEKKLPFINLFLPKKKNDNEFFYSKIYKNVNEGISNRKKISKIFNNSIIHKSLNTSRNFPLNNIDKHSHY